MRNLIQRLKAAADGQDWPSLRDELRTVGLAAEAALAAMGFPNSAIDELRSTPFESCFAQWHADRSGPLAQGWFVWADLRSAAPRGCDVPSETTAEFRNVLRTHCVRRLVASGIADGPSRLFYQTAWCQLSKKAIIRALAATQFARGFAPPAERSEFHLELPKEAKKKSPPIQWLQDPFYRSEKPNARTVDFAVQLGTAAMGGPTKLGEVILTDDLVIRWMPSDDGIALDVPEDGLPLGRLCDLPPEAYQALFRRANAQTDLWSDPSDAPKVVPDDPEFIKWLSSHRSE